MKQAFSLANAVLLFFIISCQNNPNTSSQSPGTPVVQGADGTLYSAQCIQANATEIINTGAAAMADCRATIPGSGATGFYPATNPWIYYPPTYWNPTTYSNSGYGSGYNPYYDTNYSGNPFCSYLFGGGSSVNCYYALGYTAPTSSYGTYYNPGCSSCLYAPDPGHCLHRCYSATPY